jgi:hypothetical protein
MHAAHWNSIPADFEVRAELPQIGSRKVACCFPSWLLPTAAVSVACGQWRGDGSLVASAALVCYFQSLAILGDSLADELTIFTH